MSADAQSDAEVTGQGTDVGAGRTFHGDIDIDYPAAVDPGDGVDVEAVDGDGPGRKLDFFTGADTGIGAFTVDLDRADAARYLLDGAGEGGDALSNRFVADLRCAARLSDFAFGVVGDGGFAEPDSSRIRLGRSHN